MVVLLWPPSVSNTMDYASSWWRFRLQRRVWLNSPIRDLHARLQFGHLKSMSCPAGAGVCARCRILALFSSQISSLFDSLILTLPLIDERHLTRSAAIVSQESATLQSFRSRLRTSF